MKIPKSAKTPTFICIFITCIVSFILVCIILALTISRDLLNQPPLISTWIIIFSSIAAMLLAIFLLAFIIRQAQFTEKEILDRLKITKAMFFQDMVHDFKTPLTVVSVNILDSEHMLDYEINIDELRENLENAQNEIMRMSRMMDSIVNEATKSGPRYDMESLNIAKLLLEGSEPYRTLLKSNGNSLVIDIPKTLPKIFGNADMLLLVMANLLSNATRYTKDGTITVSAKTTGNYITVTVADTGAGIDPKILSSVFKRGVSDKGTGQGLSICKSIIEAHSGKISIESALNEGTSIYFTIPTKEA